MKATLYVHKTNDEAELDLPIHGLREIVEEFSACYRLTRRESEILALMAAHGFTNREVAERCMITEKTVKIHISNMMKKIGIGSIRKLFSLLFCHYSDIRTPNSEAIKITVV